jgi:hypothetical protein
VTVAFDTSGAVLAPRSDGFRTGLYAWNWAEIGKPAQDAIKSMGFTRFADVPRDLLTSMLAAQVSDPSTILPSVGP